MVLENSAFSENQEFSSFIAPGFLYFSRADGSVVVIDIYVELEPVVVENSLWLLHALTPSLSFSFPEVFDDF